MKVRFEAPESTPEESEAYLRVHYAPARRPRLRYAGWYVLMAMVGAVIGMAALSAFVGAWCG